MIDSKDRAAEDAPANQGTTTDENADAAANQDGHSNAKDAAAVSDARKAAKAPVPERYRHFKHLPPRSHQWIEKNCGTWVLDAMRNYLLDPDRVFPDWGTRFAVTLKDIGRDEVERMGEAEVLYDYVMTSPFWEINYQIRKRLMASKPQRKRKPTGRGKGPHKSRSTEAKAATTESTPEAEQKAGQKAEQMAEQKAEHQAEPEQRPVMAEPEPTTPVKS